MKKWERIVDRQVAEAIGDGDVSHLSGAGKKLALPDNSNTPDELRAAFKIMGDHDVMPEWIAAGQGLDQAEVKLRGRIQTATRHYRRRLRSNRAEDKQVMRERVERNWNRFVEAYLEDVGRHNREVLIYNLTLPSGIPHKPLLQSEDLIKQALVNDC